MVKVQDHFSLKRERIKGRYFWVVREKGRFREIKRYRQKQKKRDLAARLRADRSIFKGRKRIILTQSEKTAKKQGYYTEEISDLRPQALRRIKKNLKTQVTVRLKVNGREYYGVSDGFYGKGGIERARKQARERAFSNLSREMGGEYDEDLGLKIWQRDRKSELREGVLQYAAVSV